MREVRPACRCQKRCINSICGMSMSKWSPTNPTARATLANWPVCAVGCTGMAVKGTGTRAVVATMAGVPRRAGAQARSRGCARSCYAITCASSELDKEAELAGEYAKGGARVLKVRHHLNAVLLAPLQGQCTDEPLVPKAAPHWDASDRARPKWIYASGVVGCAGHKRRSPDAIVLRVIVEMLT